ncbi:dsDNA nuclease domain-containing protein [Candidatus Nitrospira neomarina]|uniref:DsDNA nuclease domain-containing protein n=1 Tax=Candidatus Nitrospira neomarina TaxID=3020899 RepID=A0AA96GIS5_9BACT|nr:dsDNA nuclease domain-containing protein [Candidatus Nitrospira neomarina]WNM61712.1 dsDNA nuclease domain-containing protein [Candidatus Nitrospira neomarina]
MPSDSLSEILEVINRDDLTEVGGGHNQKGVDFQRYWGMMKIVELEEENAEDFLLLFEALQDIAVLDSCITPKTICIYQVKKKDRNEWKWAELTALPSPKTPGKRSSTKKVPLIKVKNSPLGKLYRSVIAFKTLKSTGHFVSNAGCDLPLEDGTNAATSLPCALLSLAKDHRELLSKSLKTIRASGDPAIKLSAIHIERTNIPVNDPGTYLVGRVNTFLTKRSPLHAGQARALVESLMAKISPLGARTDTCKTPDEVRRQHGYSKDDFVDALDTLNQVPDLLLHLEDWLTKLNQEGMGIMDITSIRVAATVIYRRQVMGAKSIEAECLIVDCESWLNLHSSPNDLIPYLQQAYNDLASKYPLIKKPELFAYFMLQAIKKCVAQT